MKKLAILRHAKSAWAIAGESDENRSLNQRGHEQMSLLNGWIEKNSFTPDHIICSTARRTCETLDLMSKSIDASGAIFDPTLYLGPVDAYLDAVWCAPDCESLLVIGHNPTCDEIVRYLSHASSPAYETLMAQHFSTGTLAIMNVDIANWSDLSRAKGSLTHFLRPKMIAEGMV